LRARHFDERERVDASTRDHLPCPHLRSPWSRLRLRDATTCVQGGQPAWTRSAQKACRRGRRGYGRRTDEGEGCTMGHALAHDICWKTELLPLAQRHATEPAVYDLAGMVTFAELFAKAA